MIGQCRVPMRALFNGLRCLLLFAPAIRDQKREEIPFITGMKLLTNSDNVLLLYTAFFS